MNLSNESKTLFIPLYAKSIMSKQNLFINDIKAEEIVNKIDFNFKDLKQSKWLTMYLAVRARIMDDICNNYINNCKDLIVIHLGCGLDSRAFRVNNTYKMWYDIDFESVIDVRKMYYEENEKYKMISSSVTDLNWLDKIEFKDNNILVIAEGLTMYLSEKELKSILNYIEQNINNTNLSLVFDAYSKKAVIASKIKNPVNQMKAKIKWGMDNFNDLLQLNKNLKYLNQYLIKYNEKNLKGITKFIFNNLYCGKLSSEYYKIYEFAFLNKHKNIN